MKSKLILIILACVLLFAACSSDQTHIAETAEITPELTNAPELTKEPMAQPTAEPTATPEPEPAKPKYIFIVIGDGFGRGAMTLGEIYSRLENQDMNMGAAWESFDYQSYVTAMGESASGGTAIASGIETDSWHIGTDLEGQHLYTIMDRAKANGYATGVITNATIYDATPGTFLAHTTNRYAWSNIAVGFSDSNVDYIAGGGMIKTLSPNTSDFDGVDCIGLHPKKEGLDEAIPSLIDLGYETYFGLDGAMQISEAVENNEFTPEKSISLFVGGQLPYDQYKYRSPNTDKYDNVPSLIDMTAAGIQSLDQNQEGFVMMIESALIDKAGHGFSQEMGTYEVAALNDLLEYLMEFYNEYPDETLIILTADHETGNYKHDDVLLNEWKTSTDFVWTDDGTEMAEAVNNEWGLLSYNENLQTQINVALSEPWDTIEENRAPLHTALTLDICAAYGTQITTSDHSAQPVPLFIMGSNYEAFEGSEHIKEIPITICEIMGWEALPELLPNEE